MKIKAKIETAEMPDNDEHAHLKEDILITDDPDFDNAPLTQLSTVFGGDDEFGEERVEKVNQLELEVDGPNGPVDVELRRPNGPVQFLIDRLADPNVLSSANTYGITKCLLYVYSIGGRRLAIQNRQHLQNVAEKLGVDGVDQVCVAVGKYMMRTNPEDLRIRKKNPRPL